jgi:hypothetical protein
MGRARTTATGYANGLIFICIMLGTGPTLDVHQWRVHRVEHCKAWKGAGAVNYFISPSVDTHGLSAEY